MAELLEDGTTLSHYRIVSRLGSGGMGEVYLADDLVLRRRVAVKILTLEDAVAGARERFLREARAAAALDHPNICSIYEVGEDGPHSFIVMHYVAGETLAASRADRQPLPLEETLAYAVQIAGALAAAHAQGIVHRDVKQNIMISAGGRVTVLDFGLARMGTSDGTSDVATDSLITAQGAVIGTAPYMSPEQVRGERVDPRSDIFSFGAVLYELLTGRRAFAGSNAIATMSAVLSEDPPPARDAGVAPELGRILGLALAKDREQRYQSIRDLELDLERFQASIGDVTRNHLAPPALGAGAGGASRGRRFLPAAVAVAVAVVLVAAGWLYLRRGRLERARGLLPVIAEKIAAESFFEAYELAREARAVLPDEPAIEGLWPLVSMNLSVTTEPPGAEVYLERFSATDGTGAGPRTRIGTTPVQDFEIGRGDYILSLEKAGYAPRDRTLSGALFRWGNRHFPGPPTIRIEQDLDPASEIPAEMVRVRGGAYRLVSWGRPSHQSVELDDFLIDRFEVSNSDYLEFIRAGGYRDSRHWTVPFLKDGRELPWDQARHGLHDRTGLPGPRDWSNQSFPEGTADHSVTGITGQEAAAYAASRGKELPTLFQWEKAARDGVVSIFAWNIMPWGPLSGVLEGRANLVGRGTLPVASAAFGMSPFGAYNMAGNAAEWCRAGSHGFFTAGGSWRDFPYLFASFERFPESFSSDAIGFRCVRNLPGAQGDQGLEWSQAAAVAPTLAATRGSDFRNLSSHYRYDPVALGGRLESVLESAEWRRETVSFNASSDDRAIAYLYLPKGFEPPFQVIQFAPASSAFDGSMPVAPLVEMALAPYLKAGRAIFAVTLKGFAERPQPPGYEQPEPGSVRFRQQIVAQVSDLRRGLDYLETRDDVDHGRVAYLGISQGARLGLIATAVEPRYRSAVFMGVGVFPSDAQRLPEVRPASFVSHVSAPKLVLAGRYDELIPYATIIEPLYRLLPEPKRLVTYDGGHTPTFEVSVPAVNGWLDKTLNQPGPEIDAVPGQGH